MYSKSIKRSLLPSEIEEESNKITLTDSSGNLVNYKDNYIIINGEKKKIINIENDTTLQWFGPR